MSSRKARQQAADEYRARREAADLAALNQHRAQHGLPPYHCWRDRFDEPEALLAIFLLVLLPTVWLDSVTGWHLGVASLTVAFMVTWGIVGWIRSTEPEDEEDR